MKIAVIHNGIVSAIKKGNYKESDLAENEVLLPNDVNYADYLGAIYDSNTKNFIFSGYNYGIEQSRVKGYNVITENSNKVYRRAFKKALALTQNGNESWLTTITNYVNLLDTNDDLRMIWEDVTIFERNHSDMKLFRDAGMSEQQLDFIFKLANSFETI